MNRSRTKFKQEFDKLSTLGKVVSIVLAIIIAREIINAGKATWIEGLMLLATYLILAIGFYHLPDAVVARDQSAAEGNSIPTVQPGAQNL